MTSASIGVTVTPAAEEMVTEAIVAKRLPVAGSSLVGELW